MSSPQRTHPRFHLDADFRDDPSLNLNQYISETLQPDEKFHDFMNKAIDNLYRQLQLGSITHTKYKIHSLIKGGSIAKGTALKGNSDLDCVLVMNDIEDASDLRDNLPYILKRIRNSLPRRIQCTNGHVWKLDTSEVKETRFALKFTMSRGTTSVDVDLLPTFEVDVENSSSREILYQTMLDDRENWKYYSAALVKLQIDFVKDQNPNVKDLIRLVKHWRKEFLPQTGNEHLPPSYLLELLTIHAWIKAGRPSTFDPKIGFKAVMELLVNHESLDIVFNTFYETGCIPGSVLGTQNVLDPANPTNNIYRDVDCWDKVKEVARKTMQKPLLQDIDITSNWNVNV